jgi:hypothetical protein
VNERYVSANILLAMPATSQSLTHIGRTVWTQSPAARSATADCFFFLMIIATHKIQKRECGLTWVKLQIFISHNSFSASATNWLKEIPKARLMRATVSTVGMRSLFSMKRIIGRERFVNSASRFNERLLDSRRSRMAFANASHTGSSAIRGNGLLEAVNGTGIFDD